MKTIYLEGNSQELHFISNMYRKISFFVFSVVLLLSTGDNNVYGQMQGVIGSGTNQTTVIAPLYRSSASNTSYIARRVMMYTQEELASIGIFPGATITRIGWYKSDGNVLTNGATATFDISIRSGVPDTQYAANQPFPAYVTSGIPFTSVGSFTFDTSAAGNVPSTANWISFDITPYVYTGGSIEVYTFWHLTPDVGNPSNGAFNFRYNNLGNILTTGNIYRNLYSNADAPANLTRDYRQLHTQFTYTPASNNASVYSLVEPALFCAGTHEVKVEVRNTGANILNNIIVNWEVDGVAQTPVTWTQPIDVWGSTAGNSAVVPLGNVPFAANVPRTIKAWTSMPNGVPDNNNVDDTLEVSIRTALNGTYTVGGNAPDYQTVADAVASLNTFGVCGPVTFSIRSGTYDGQVQIDSVRGANAINSVTFRSERNHPDSVMITFRGTSSATNYVFRLNRASYINLKQLSFRSTGTSNQYGIVLEMQGDVSNLSVDSCKFFSPVATVQNNQSACVFADGVSGTDHSFTNNNFYGGSIGIYYRGSGISAGQFLYNPLFQRNTIEETYYYALYTSNTVNLRILNNRIVTTATNPSHYGLNINSSYDALEVAGNYISGQVAGHAMYFTGSYGSVNQPGLIYNNVISIGNGTPSNLFGIYSTNSRHQKFYNNSVNITGATNTTSNGFAGYFGNSSTSNPANEIYNNIFANTGGGGALYIQNPQFNISDYNNLYTTGNLLVRKNVAPAISHATLTAWRDSSGHDRNSISYRPAFMSATDLRPNPADSAAWAINGRGMHLSGNNLDFTGNNRSTAPINGVPDLGAYEFIPTAPLAPQATAIPAIPYPDTVQVFLFGQDTVARIHWKGATVPSQLIVRQYSGRVPPARISDSMYFYTDMQSATTGTFDYDAVVYYKDPWMGNIQAEPALRLAKRDGTSPWINYTGAGSSVDVDRNTLGVTGLTSFSLFTGTGEPCSGAPSAPVLTTSDITGSQCPGSSFALAATGNDQLSGFSYQWQQSSAPGGPWVDVTGGTGANTLNYTTGPLFATTYFHIVATCVNGGQQTASNYIEIPVAPSAVVTSTTDGQRCGPGVVLLGAQGSQGATLYWYDVPNGGAVLDTGLTYMTPALSSTTDYYVSAASVDKTEYLPGPNVGVNQIGNSNGRGLIFSVTRPLTINTVDIYPRNSAAHDTATIQVIITDLSNNMVYSGPVDTFSVTTEPILRTVPVAIALQPGEYKMTVAVTRVNNMIYESSNVHFPYSGPSGSIIISRSGTNNTGGTTLTSYYFFYNWSISIPCEGPRLPVTATIGGNPPSLEVSATPIVCNNGIAELFVTSPAADFDSVTWHPLIGLYTDAAATIPYTGQHADTVYARRTTAGVNSYIAQGYNTFTECGGTDTARFFVQPSAALVVASPAAVCGSGTAAIRLEHSDRYAAGSLQWQSSSDNTNFTDITGANNSIYNTPVLSSSTYFRATIKNSSGDFCITPADSILVSDVRIISNSNPAHCGPGIITLEATGAPGNRLKWYDAASGGNLLDTGGVFVTPMLYSTASYYVSATGGKRAVHMGRREWSTTRQATSTNGGLIFDAFVPFTLESVSIYPIGTGNGTITVALINGRDTFEKETINLTGTDTPGTKIIVPLHFYVPAGAGYSLRMISRTGGVTGLVREITPVGSSAITYPMQLPGIASIVNSVNSNVVTNKYYEYFYDWLVSVPCESPRTQVTATITPAPAFTAEAIPDVICVGDTTLLTTTSANTGYTYEWTPGPLTGGSVPVSPSVRTVYHIRALDNSGGPNNGCVGYDSVTVIVNTLPVVSLTAAGATTFCEGDSVLMFASTGAGYSYQWQRDNTDIPGAVNSSFYAKEDGLHTVRITDVNSCSAISDPEDITVHLAPEPVITPAGNGLTTGSFNSYQWYRNGVLISGATDQSHTPEGVGSYTVVVTDVRGCQGTSDPYQYGGTNVNAIQSDRNVRIYPNPASSTVYIESPVPVQVTLSSVDGKVVFHQKGVQQIDVSNLSDAVYMIRVADLNGQVLNLSRLTKAAK